MLYREIIAVCSQIHTKHTNTLCGQIHLLLTSALDEGEWSTSSPGPSNPRKKPRHPLNPKLGGPHNRCRQFCPYRDSNSNRLFTD